MTSRSRMSLQPSSIFKAKVQSVYKVSLNCCSGFVFCFFFFFFALKQCELNLFPQCKGILFYVSRPWINNFPFIFIFFMMNAIRALYSLQGFSQTAYSVLHDVYGHAVATDSKVKLIMTPHTVFHYSN